MMRPILSLIGLSLLVSSPAYAWRHTGFVWTPDQMPVVFYVAEDGAEDKETCQDSVPNGVCREVAEWAAEQWNNVPCADAEVEIADEPIANANTLRNGINEIVFEDPLQQMDDPQTIAFSQSTATGAQVEVNGQLYQQLNDADITFGVNRGLATIDQIAAGCDGRINIESTMTHEMGHSLGMAHSCEEEDICVDPELRDATMFWTSKGACDISRSELGPDDINSYQALYGPLATFQCSGENDNGSILGVVPFDLSCAIASNSAPDITDVNWNWGDGGNADSLAAGHTYEAAGNYTIQVTVNGQSAACYDEESGESGEWSYDYRRVGYVTACDVVQGEFEVNYVDGLTYKMLNDSDVSVYGCILQIQWMVFEGEGTKGKVIEQVAAWEPEFTFPESGTYTVLMNLGGPAGTSGASVVLDVKPGNGSCSTVSTGAGAFGMLSLLGMLGLRRRR
jgi:uncharacterized protein (TIGR03382 family)